jgi:hypothetical protein
LFCGFSTTKKRKLVDDASESNKVCYSISEIVCSLFHVSLESWFCTIFDSHRLINLLYSIIFSPPSTFCILNFLKIDLHLILLIEENTISAIHLLPASLICFHLYPSFLINSISSLLNGHPLFFVDVRKSETDCDNFNIVARSWLECKMLYIDSYKYNYGFLTGDSGVIQP